MGEGHGGKFDAVPDTYVVTFMFRQHEYTETVKAISRKEAVRKALLKVVFREVRPVTHAQSRAVISAAYETAKLSARVINKTQRELERRMSAQKPPTQIVMDL